MEKEKEAFLKRYEIRKINERERFEILKELFRGRVTPEDIERYSKFGYYRKPGHFFTDQYLNGTSIETLENNINMTPEEKMDKGIYFKDQVASSHTDRQD